MAGDPQIKIQGQFKPAAATEELLFAVNATCSFVVSVMSACNMSGGADTLRVRVEVDGDSPDDKQWIYYDYPVAANDSVRLDCMSGLTLFEGDEIYVYSTSGNIVFNVSGEEALALDRLSY